MNDWIRKNKTKFYSILNELEEHHLRGGYGGELKLNEIYTTMTQLYKEVSFVQTQKELAVADLRIANEKIKDLEKKLTEMKKSV